MKNNDIRKDIKKHLNVKKYRFSESYEKGSNLLLALANVIGRKNMSRPLRIQYSGACYHVMNRGRRGEKIFGIDKNSTVGSVVVRVRREMRNNKKIFKRVKNLKGRLIKS